MSPPPPAQIWYICPPHLYLIGLIGFYLFFRWFIHSPNIWYIFSIRNLRLISVLCPQFNEISQSESRNRGIVGFWHCVGRYNNDTHVCDTKHSFSGAIVIVDCFTKDISDLTDVAPLCSLTVQSHDPHRYRPAGQPRSKKINQPRLSLAFIFFLCLWY